MGRTDGAYLEELTVHLRLAEVAGSEIGAILEEAQDHLAASGETPQEAFGSPEEYARALALAHGKYSSAPLRLSRADLLAGAAQIAGWAGVVYGVVAIGTATDVQLLPGHVASWSILTGGLLWPVWPVVRALTARKTGVLSAAATLAAVVAASIVPAVTWHEPVLATFPAVPVVVLSLVVIGACWVRAWRVRDPVRRPIGPRNRRGD